ncbi:MAG TPA: DNA mismatch repair protein MutL, partial [Ruminococcaceae bacterium]|nr:DNA mismatch repair protein MutL [Oscillospiraceae bacterium]
EEKPEIRIIGEAFSTYIIAETGSSIYMIDKHAAHERILFNELKKRQSSEVQALLTPVTVTLTPEEYGAVTQNTEILSKAGFEIEDFGNTSVRVYAVPATLTKEDTEALVSELAGSLLKTSRPEIERLEDIYHTVACRAAIKAGNRLSPLEMKKLAERVLGSDDVMYCPHGRPVAFEIKRRELEKQFGRIQ